MQTLLRQITKAVVLLLEMAARDSDHFVVPKLFKVLFLRFGSIIGCFLLKCKL